MRKNLITVITLALVLVNLVLTAIMAVAIMPEINKVNSLVTKISDAIDLDIASNPSGSSANISMDAVQVQSFENTMTIPLADSGDGKDHMAVIGITLSVNTNSDAFANYSDMTTYEGVIRTEVNNIVHKYTLEELKADIEGVQDEIRDDLNALFGSDLIAAVGFSTVTYQ